MNILNGRQKINFRTLKVESHQVRDLARPGALRTRWESPNSTFGGTGDMKNLENRRGHFGFENVSWFWKRNIKFMKNSMAEKYLTRIVHHFGP